MTDLLVRSLAPFDSGWKLVEALHLIPVINVRCFQNEDINSLSRSEIISIGRPFSQYQLSKKSDANCLAVSVVVVGIILMSEPRRSVIVKMQSWP